MYVWILLLYVRYANMHIITSKMFHVGVAWLDEKPAYRVMLTAMFVVHGVLDVMTREVVIKLPERLRRAAADVASEFAGSVRFDVASSTMTSNDAGLYELFRGVVSSPALPAFLLSERTAVGALGRAISEVFLPGGVGDMASCRADSLQHLALHARATLTVQRLDESQRSSRVSLVTVDASRCRVSRSKAPRVFCVEVPSHVFLVRRAQGPMTPVWTGNSSRHGQKGTIGMIYRQEDMPFSRDGIVPDIIINPHAIPSRMTVAQLMECIMGKACVALGTFGDATPFTNLKVTDLTDLLQANGMERHGNELLHNSRTGEQLQTTVFMGPTFYQRLKHMVDDKIHSRAASGPVVMMTRQPAEGRARDGGLRLGEMEIECNWAHGTMQFLKERFMECSDNYRVHICRRCGMMATANPEKSIYNCRACKNINHFAEIRIPYACKLFLQEVQVMNIGARFLL